MPRPIITINEDKCNGCGQCILDCAEGALAIVGGKAKLINEIYCDGLGACLNCPQGALTLSMQDAPPFNEKAALEAKKQREDAVKADMTFVSAKLLEPLRDDKNKIVANLRTWPIQLELVPPNASFLYSAPILLAAHCAGFAAPDIHGIMKDHISIIACPKLEKQEILVSRLAAIISANETPAIDILRMSVPCCALPSIVEQAVKKSGTNPRVINNIINLN